MIKFKEIRLYPSLFYLDIFITKDLKALREIFNERYGLDEDGFYGTQINEVGTIDSCKKSLMKGETRIYTIIESIKKSDIIVHESQHILDHLNRLTNIDLSESSTEWKSMFVEYLFTEITDKNNYKQI